jgi:hypothetical protein
VNVDPLELAKTEYLHRRRWPVKVTITEDEGGLSYDYAQDGPDVLWCLQTTRTGQVCRNKAGAGTPHRGAGLCWQHEGSRTREGAWIMAHAFARALDCTPWEGLLLAVKIAAGRVAFCEHKIGTATEDRQLEPPDKNCISEAGRTQDQQGTNLYLWVKQAELWHAQLAKVSVMAINAGVAERLVRQLELEARIMLQATHRTLDELGFSDDEKQRAVVIMSRNLLALEAEEVGLTVKETE